MRTFLLLLFACANCGDPNAPECSTVTCDDTSTSGLYTSCTTEAGITTFTFGSASCSCNSRVSGAGDCDACATAVEAYCEPNEVNQPYESCQAGATCNGQTQCVATTLPMGAGYAGNVCTTTCSTNGDCAQRVANNVAICVNAQCYVQCPGASGTCPYGATECLAIATEAGTFNICSP